MSVPGADAFGRLTREAVAEVLGYSTSTLASWAVAGIGPKPFKEKGGKRVFYMADDVRAFALGEKAA